MRPTRSDTAILLFSRSAAAEYVEKPLVDAAEGIKRAVSAQMIRQTRRVARRSGLPVYFVSEKQQRGDTFGERFAHAFELLFGQGLERVIAIGNDCPALRPDDLVEAANSLDAAGLVFGPAVDGGAYLIGMRREAYDREAFLHIDWQTPAVLQELEDYAAGDYLYLGEKSDVDSPADLLRALRGSRTPTLLKIRLLVFLKRHIPTVLFRTDPAAAAVFMDCRALRGPPVLERV
ncbi:MAG: DUF2064 domain-containing protein [Lewinellaceae bacterium]|nr:DUF2064 domain-containing protein [Lewinellaceae bacterium]